MNHPLKLYIFQHIQNKSYTTSTNLNFIPKHLPVKVSAVENLREFISNSKTVLVLTGAGTSTESGIPDYRSEEVGLYARLNHKPIQYQEFLKSKATRKRYWARNFVGWPRFSSFLPNLTHRWIKDLELVQKKVSCVVTQNVDGLHYKAGSSNVIELHGSAYRVYCLDCDAKYSRQNIQTQLIALNPTIKDISNMIRPDGDVEISPDIVERFNDPYCTNCGGTLKPDIVFFGDNVPRNRVNTVSKWVSTSDALLVLGSSLHVFSAYRIVLQALEENKNIAIVNIGKTRADDRVKLKVSASCSDVLSKINL